MANFRVIDPVSTQVAKAVRKQGAFVTQNAFPVIEVDQCGGQILSYGPEDFVPVDDIVTENDCPNVIQVGRYDGLPYVLDMHALIAKVPSKYRIDGRVVNIDLLANGITTLMRRMNLNWEIELTGIMRAAGTYPANHVLTPTGTDQWHDADSDPKLTVDTAREQIRTAIGVYPNTMIVSQKLATLLYRHPTILPRWNSVQVGLPGDDFLQQYFNVDNFWVSKGHYYDKGTNGMVDSWDYDVWLGYVAPPSGSNSKESAEPSFAYTYQLRGHPVSLAPVHDPLCLIDQTAVHWWRDPVVTCAGAGALIQDAAAP